MKKIQQIALAAALITGIAGAGTALAYNNNGHNGEGQGHRSYNGGGHHQKMTAEDRAAIEQFKTDNAQLFKDVVVTSATLKAVYKNDTPNPAEASKLAGELFDLKEQVKTKREAAGLNKFAMSGKKGSKGHMKLDEKTVKDLSQFRADNIADRKAIVMKKAAKRAIMVGQNPDPQKVGQLTGEIYDIEQSLQAKAKKAGLPVNLACPMMGGKKGGKMMMGGCQMMGGKGMGDMGGERGKHHGTRD